MSRIVQILLIELRALIFHQYGNYAVQHILEYGTPFQKGVVAEELLKNIRCFSKHRNGSHVVCKALEHGGPADIHRLASALLDNENKELWSREYGSFVMRVARRSIGRSQSS